MLARGYIKAVHKNVGTRIHTFFKPDTMRVARFVFVVTVIVMLAAMAVGVLLEWKALPGGVATPEGSTLLIDSRQQMHFLSSGLP